MINYLSTNKEVITLILGILNFLVLTATLIILFIYTIYTRQIAKQTISANLVPLLLRVGKVDFNTIEGTIGKTSTNFEKFIRFVNNKNIALDIQGYIIVNQKKYKLYFGNSLTTYQGIQEVLPKWQSLPTNAELLASYNMNSGEDSVEDNKIYITYKDTEGNLYYTNEDKNYDVISKKL